MIESEENKFLHVNYLCDLIIKESSQTGWKKDKTELYFRSLIEEEVQKIEEEIDQRVN
jgi:hypothetical protein